MTLGELLAHNTRGMIEVLERRIEDLTDAEMHWEPVAGCLRLGDPAPRASHFDGTVEPVATIGWRLGHIATGGLGNPRNAAWLGVDAAPPSPPALDGASAMRAWLARSVEWWCGLVAGIDDERLWQPVGEVGGAFNASPRAGFVLHIGNDVTHHAAEVGVLRDLWRAGLR